MRSVRCFALLAALVFGSASAAFAVGGGDITFPLKNADPVLFSHDHHSKARGLKCAACHFTRFASGTGYELKKELITKQEFCNLCHNGMKSFDSGSERNCIRCHRKDQQGDTRP